MSQVRDNLRKQWRSLIIAMGIVIGIVVGCGGGGGGGGAQSASTGGSSSQQTNSAASSTVGGGNNIILSVQRAASKLPSNTVRVRATIVGTNISAIADFGPDILAVTLELFAPLGPQTVRIDALDANGNVVASGEIQVTVGSGPSAPVTVPVDSLVASSPTPTPSASPVASPSPSISPSPSASPSASPQTPALQFSVQPPQQVVSKLPFSVSVGAFDATTHQPLSTFNGPVTLTLSPNPGNDSFPATTVNAVNGVATFSDLVIVNPASGYQFQAASPGLTSGSSNAFAVVQATLKFIVQPRATQPFGANMQPQGTGIQVAVVDPNGATITSVNGLGVTMGVTPNPNGTALLGATSVAVVNGVASFRNLQMNATGLGFALVASAGNGRTLSQTSTTFNVGPAVSPGTVYFLTESGGQTHGLAGYDVNSLVAVAPPTAITGYVPVAISVWPGNGNAAAAVLVLGDNNTLHFFNATTLQELTAAVLTLPTSTGTPNINPSMPKLIKKDPSRDIFYITAKNNNGDLIDIVDMSNGPAGATASAASGLGGSHGLGVDPGLPNTPSSFVMTQGNYGVQGDTINSGPPVTLTDAGSGSTSLPGTDSYLDVVYLAGSAVALNTYGNITYGPTDQSITWFPILGSTPSSVMTSLDSFGSAATNDARSDVRFYQSIDGASSSTATALVCNSTSNMLEMVTFTYTPGVGNVVPAGNVTHHFGFGSTDVSITSAVTDPNGTVKSPQRLSLCKNSGTFVQAFSTSATSQQVPVVDLLTGGHPTVYGTIDLGTGTSSTATAVLQGAQVLTGQ